MAKQEVVNPVKLSLHPIECGLFLMLQEEEFLCSSPN